MSLIIVSDKQGPKVNKNHPKHKASHNSSTSRNKVGLLSVGGNRSCFPARWECLRVVHLPVGAALDFERGLVGQVVLHVGYLGAVVAGVGHLVADGDRGLGRNGQEAGSGGLPLMTSTLERKQKRTVEALRNLLGLINILSSLKSYAISLSSLNSSDKLTQSFRGALGILHYIAN